MQRRFILFFYTIVSLIFITAYAGSRVELQEGDLLFQELNSDPITDAVTAATTGYDHRYISHIAIVVNNADSPEPEVIEAYKNGVEAVPLSVFLARSVDAQGRPRVMVGRLKPEYQVLIPEAVISAKAQLGQPYNKELLLGATGLYCSQLIAYIFKQANNDKDFFQQKPMNFKSLKTHRYPAAWKMYFKSQNKSIPQGLPGTNPAEMSRDSRVQIVYIYGQLSQQQTAKRKKSKI